MTTIAHEPTTIERLTKLRDELRLEIHLAKAEVKDYWNELEEKWRTLRRNRQRIESATSKSAKEVQVAAGLLLDELAEGYERIRKAL